MFKKIFLIIIFLLIYITPINKNKFYLPYNNINQDNINYQIPINKTTLYGTTNIWYRK